MTTLEKLGLKYLLQLLSDAETAFNAANRKDISQLQQDTYWGEATENLTIAIAELTEVVNDG